MEIKANNIIVGAFVLAMLVSGFSFVYWVRNIGGSTSEQTYGILFESSIGGLTEGANVYFNGLKVGRVKTLRIYPGDSRKIEGYIAIRKTTPVRTNSRAKVTTQGLTGYAAIEITPGTPDADRLMPATGSEFAFINADRGSSSSIADAIPEAVQNATALLSRLNDVVANNEDSLRQSVKNIEGFTGMLAERKDDISEALKSVKDLARKFDQIEGLILEAKNTFKNANSLLGDNSEKVSNSLENIEKFTSVLARNEDEIDSFVKDMKNISATFKSVGVKLEKTLDSFSGFISDADGESFFSQAKEAATSFQRLAAKLDASFGDDSADISRSAKTGLKEFELFMREGRRAAKSLERVLDNFEKNPQSLLLGGESVPEYTPN